MRVLILDDAAQTARRAAQIIESQILNKPGSVLGLATGGTQELLYSYLVDAHRSARISFSRVTSFNLDEYYDIEPTNPQSYSSYMQRHLFDHIDINSKRTHLPICSASDNLEEVGANYEQAIEAAGGIDLQILGIGENGHIGFNEPTSNFASKTRLKTLTQTTQRSNARLFAADECQPKMAMTMGIATIMEARQIIVLATGNAKANAISSAIEGPVSAMCPASVLQMHSNVTYLIDRHAAATLKYRDYYERVIMHEEAILSTINDTCAKGSATNG